MCGINQSVCLCACLLLLYLSGFVSYIRHQDFIHKSLLSRVRGSDFSYCGRTYRTPNQVFSTFSSLRFSQCSTVTTAEVSRNHACSAFDSRQSLRGINFAANALQIISGTIIMANVQQQQWIRGKTDVFLRDDDGRAEVKYVIAEKSFSDSFLKGEKCTRRYVLLCHRLYNFPSRCWVRFNVGPYLQNTILWAPKSSRTIIHVYHSHDTRRAVHCTYSRFWSLQLKVTFYTARNAQRASVRIYSHIIISNNIIGLMKTNLLYLASVPCVHVVVDIIRP